jgi:nucleotide-binding universal stress UspA family protein
MMKVLLPVDGSSHSQRVIRYVIGRVRKGDSMELHVLNVQEPIDSLEMRRFKLPQEIKRMQRKQGDERLRAACARLDDAGVRYKVHSMIGPVAATIARAAKQLHCEMIIMGTRGMTPLASLVLGSVATKVIHLSDVPVTLVK